MSKKGISHESIKAETDKQKAEKDAPKVPTNRDFLKRLHLACTGKNDDELPEIVAELRAICDEYDPQKDADEAKD